MVFAGGGGAGFLSGRQIVPVDYEADISQRLIKVSLDNDLKSAIECLADPFIDVNYVGAVCLKIRKADVFLREELPCEVRFDYQEFRTDATALFVAVTCGNLPLVKKLLSAGASVNMQLFRGFATTVAVREGQLEILKILIKAGASQPACEEAILEASNHGRSEVVELLMTSDLIRPHIAVHALVTACSRGFIDVLDTLIKSGVDANATDRVLLQSCKPTLHTNADCGALVAAVISRQISAVHLLLQAGIKTDVEVQLGAWSWDMYSGEEFRVGAGLAEPYPITWCAVEYFESTGSILKMLFQHLSPDAPHHGRTLLHHAILCDNVGALKVLLKHGANIETPIKTNQKIKSRPIHMAARLGHSEILQILINSNSELNSETESGETALMIAVRYKRGECVQLLVNAGADLGLVNITGQSASSLASSGQWYLGFQQAILNVVKSGNVPFSTNPSVFSPLFFVARSGDVIGLKALIDQLTDINLDEQDERGFSPVMITAMEGHVDAFRFLVHAGADVKLCNKSGETALTLSKLNQKRDLFEKVMLEFALEKGNRFAGGFYALHFATRCGDFNAVKLLANKGYDVNASDGDGYTPLMLAAKEGNAKICEFLISCGANCEVKNRKGESALSLARKLNGNEAENVILNALARKLVLGGSLLQKHTKEGKGAPHAKVVKMVGSTGVLRWGKSRCRNVVCREAEVGPSLRFQRNRQGRGDANEPGIFHVITMNKKEMHFVCDGGKEMAELWVRGIRLLSGEKLVSGSGD